MKYYTSPACTPLWWTLLWFPLPKSTKRCCLRSHEMREISRDFDNRRDKASPVCGRGMWHWISTWARKRTDGGCLHEYLNTICRLHLCWRYFNMVLYIRYPRSRTPKHGMEDDIIIIRSCTVNSQTKPGHRPHMPPTNATGGIQSGWLDSAVAFESQY